MHKNSSDNKSNPIGEGLYLGTGMMLCQAPFVNVFNAISVTASKQSTNSIKSCHLLYLGTQFNQNGPSIFNYFRGMSAHLLKETPRLVFKPIGLYTLKPWLDSNFSPLSSALFFATALSIGEVIINPADAIRVQRQSV